MIFAQFETAPEGLSSTYFTPLFLAAVMYVGLYVAARVLEGRDDDRSETAEDLGFALILLCAGYVAILAVVAVASEMDLVWDLVRILVVVVVFFLVLALILLLVFELGTGGPGGLHPAWVFVFTIITLGIYGYAWYYSANKDLVAIGKARGTDELGTSPGVSLLAITLGALVIVPLVYSLYKFCRRLEAARQLTGTPGGMGVVPIFLLCVFLYPIGIAIAQSSLNKMRRSQVGGRPGPAAAVAG